MQPKSIRLNRELRDKFVKHVMEDVMPVKSFPEEEAFLQKITPDIYDIIYGPILPLLKQLPAWAVKTSSETFLIFEAEKNSAQVKIKFKEPKLCLSKVTEYQSRAYAELAPTPSLSREHPLSQEYFQIRQHQIDWKVKRTQFQNQLYTLINDCNTTAQLFTGWPEAAKYAYIFPNPNPTSAEPPKISALELNLGLSMTKVVVNQIQDN